MNITTIWLLVGIALLLSEFLIPGFLIFFFGVGALLLSIMLKMIPAFHGVIWLQIVLFIIISIVLLVTLRSKFRKILHGDLYKEKEDYVGEECKVVETVYKDKPGRIKYQGTTWEAYAENSTVKKNQMATILRKKDGEPMVFIIEKKQIKEKK